MVYFVESTPKGRCFNTNVFFFLRILANLYFIISFPRSLKTYGKSISSTTEWAHNSSQFKKLVAKCLKRNADGRETARSERRVLVCFLLVFLSQNPLTFFFLSSFLSCLVFLSCLSSQLLKLPFVKLSPTEHAVALRELSDAIGVIDVDQIEGKRMDDAVRLCM